MDQNKVKTNHKQKAKMKQMSHEDDIEKQAAASFEEAIAWAEESTLNSTLDVSTKLSVSGKNLHQKRSKRIRSNRKKWDSLAYEESSGYLENDYLGAIDHISYELATNHSNSLLM